MTWFYLQPKPSCEDGILNQNEEQIDCGGICISCEAKNFQLIIGSPQSLDAGEGKVTIVASIENTNQNYAVKGVRYLINIKDKIGRELKTIEKDTNISPTSIRYIIEPGLNFNYQDVGRIEIKILSELDLVPIQEFFVYEIATRQLDLKSDEEKIIAEGIVSNMSGRDIESLKLIGLIKDDGGNLIRAGSTTISSLEAFKTSGYTIFIPSISGIPIENLNLEIFWEVIS